MLNNQTTTTQTPKEAYMLSSIVLNDISFNIISNEPDTNRPDTDYRLITIYDHVHDCNVTLRMVPTATSKMHQLFAAEMDQMPGWTWTDEEFQIVFIMSEKVVYDDGFEDIRIPEGSNEAQLFHYLYDQMAPKDGMPYVPYFHSNIISQ